jgi:hypothetical protein
MIAKNLNKGERVTGYAGTVATHLKLTLIHGIHDRFKLLYHACHRLEQSESRFEER